MSCATLWRVLLFACVTLTLNSSAQTGCTDATACNYDSTAIFDDGTCVYGDMDYIAVPDSLCLEVIPGQQFYAVDLISNDGFCPGAGWYAQPILTNDECLGILSQSLFIINIDNICCGQEVILDYFVFNEFNEDIQIPSTLVVEIKCPKPDCSFIDLTLVGGDGAAGDGQGGCVAVCENSVSTVAWPFNPGNGYSWDVTGGSFVPGSNDAEIVVTWGAAGAGSIILTETVGGIEFPRPFCVDIMTSPTANFTAPANVCLNQTVCFDNLSLDADAYFWEFGDGGTSTAAEPCHEYAAPGTYTVTLTAKNDNYDAQGNQLCCCTDVFTQEIIVEDLEGPSIYWVSTLCEGDTSKYWTDATGCDYYDWTVTDFNGDPITFDGDGNNNDTICVVWTTGPVGNISLDVTNCDTEYCDFPTEATVPIIPSVGAIDGEIEVCQFSTEVYSLPKWAGTTYDWAATGGTIVSDNGGHSVAINWGPAGTGTITVNYVNDFLQGLPNHEAPDCSGYAELTVSIVPEFSLFNPSPQVCVGDFVNISVLGAVSPDFTWTITPFTPFADNGDNIDIPFVTEGTYVIEAVPNNPADYCNDAAITVVQAFDVPTPVGIDGPTEICPGETYYYSVISPDPGLTYNWTFGNATTFSTTGTTVPVEWTGSTPAAISVTATMFTFPGCTSDPFSMAISPKLQTPFMAIDGAIVCTNQVESFAILPAPHPDSEIVWTVDDPDYGSVIAGQGTSAVDVQWNNDAMLATLTATITLCGQTTVLDMSGTLLAPIQPTITPSGTLCNGITIDLDAPGTFVGYDWSTGDTGPTTTIGSPGIYSLTTEDINGCFATVYTEINNVPGPDAIISTGDLTTICINNPHTVEIIAVTNPDLEFEWICNGVSQGPASPVSTFIHPFQGVPGTYTYYAIVTDTNTGCVSISNEIDVIESLCDGGDPCEDPELYSLVGSAVNQSPACNAVDFSYTSSPNFTLTIWSFGDGTTSGAASPSHLYTQAGCYPVVITGTIPDQAGGVCEVSQLLEACVPLAADFDFDYVGCSLVDFTDFSTYIADPGNEIDTWSWDFGGYGSSSMEDPSFDFPVSGTIPVTLTVTNDNGCVASITQNVVIGSVGAPVISISPSPVCAGQPAYFDAPATGAVFWTWDFGDGATFFGPNPEHTYISGGTYTVSVTVEDVEGCTRTETIDLVVYPGVPEMEITAAPDFTICEGETTTLSVPSGYTYLWSNGDTGNTTDVGEGTYSVDVTDADGCMLSLGPVEVQEIQSPDATIFGSPILCDGNSTMLQTTFEAGNTYQWLSNGVDDIGTASSVTIDASQIGNSITVTVTNSFGCSTVSDPIVISAGVSPVFTLTASPDNCEGTPSTISISPIDPDVVYTWSTGDTGTSIVTSQAGDYTVTATNTLTGCSSSQSITFVPAPEICTLPPGCYTACYFDEICADDVPGWTYQWNLGGSPILGATTPCINVTSDGEYTVTVTNENGCSTTTDPLVLELIICDEDPCDDVSIAFDYLLDSNGDPDSCCVSLSYTNDYINPLMGLMISSTDTDFSWDLSSVSTDFMVSSVGTDHLSLTNSTLGDPIPTGTVSGFVEFCLTDVINNPQNIVVDWYDFDDMIACSDTFQLDCIDEPDCLYLLEDSIYCENGMTFYEMTLCNPADSDFGIGYIEIVTTGPAGIILDPPFIDITGTPIAPGDCQTFTIQLLGSGIAGEEFCFTLTGHKSDPTIDETTPCCSLLEEYCITIPPCDPCADVGIADVHPTSDEDCCHEITIYNDFDPDLFDEIVICMLSPATTFTLNNPFGSGWTTASYTETTASLLPDGGTLGLGTFTLPEICIETNVAPDQLVEIKWLSGGNVLCSDTVAVSCDPPCGYITGFEFECKDNGWVFQGTLHNTSDYTIGEAVVLFSDPLLAPYNTTIDVDPLLPGGTYLPFQVLIGYEYPAGTEICFTVTLHEINADGQYLTCCNFEHCVIVPECDTEPACLCGDEFEALVDQGIDFAIDISDPYTVTMQLTTAAEMLECDQVIFYPPDQLPNSGFLPASDSWTTTLVSEGPNTICARVVRTQDDGTVCVEKICGTVTILIPPSPITVYPNPTEGDVNFKFNASFLDPVYLTIIDNTLRPIKEDKYYEVSSGDQFTTNLDGCADGMYTFIFRIGEQIYVEKVVLQH